MMTRVIHIHRALNFSGLLDLLIRPPPVMSRVFALFRQLFHTRAVTGSGDALVKWR